MLPKRGDIFHPKNREFLYNEVFNNNYINFFQGSTYLVAQQLRANKTGS